MRYLISSLETMPSRLKSTISKAVVGSKYGLRDKLYLVTSVAPSVLIIVLNRSLNDWAVEWAKTSSLR